MLLPHAGLLLFISWFRLIRSRLTVELTCYECLRLNVWKHASAILSHSLTYSLSTYHNTKMRHLISNSSLIKNSLNKLYMELLLEWILLAKWLGRVCAVAFSLQSTLFVCDKKWNFFQRKILLKRERKENSMKTKWILLELFF